MIDPAATERMIEALLFAAAEPLSDVDLAARLPLDADVAAPAVADESAMDVPTIIMVAIANGSTDL